MSTSYHSIILANNQLYGWGNNWCGQLGIRNTTNQSTPQKIEFKGNPVQIALGGEHTIILTSRTLYACGQNDRGQLGLGNTANQVIPTEIKEISGNTLKVSCGENHSIALLSDGSLYGWGYNEYGQLGIGNTSNQTIPTKLLAIQNKVLQVECGGNFSMALTCEGLLYCWGENDKGQLGIGSNSNEPTPQRVLGLTNVIQLSCGYSHVLALTKDGQLFSWGHNGDGRLGLGNNTNLSVPTKITTIPSKILQIACGGQHSMALCSDGSLYSWGWNAYGQLGIGNTQNQSLPKKVIGISERIREIRCGYSHSMVITTRDNLYIWGRNEYGQLGNGNHNNETTPIIIKILKESAKLSFDNKGVNVECPDSFDPPSIATEEKEEIKSGKDLNEETRLSKEQNELIRNFSRIHVELTKELLLQCEQQQDEILNHCDQQNEVILELLKKSELQQLEFKKELTRQSEELEGLKNQLKESNKLILSQNQLLVKNEEQQNALKNEILLLKDIILSKLNQKEVN
eukprot:TRINITY_DN4597_c0_g1_i1.p1 TRINITY_DN4597_c0_g1~~TRINITY_DN4597_c0_g1_i1.p1  ORF type:complete len:514 (-),score=118.61 TRINITY_DN4597_c0_g1_i1:43-1584(-)